MKWFLFICLLFLSFTSSAFSFISDSAKTINIITRDEDVAAFRTIGRIFNSSGYDLEDSEEALMVVTTEIMDKDCGLFKLNKIALRLRAEIQMTDTITIIKLSGDYLDKGKISSELTESYFDKYSNQIAHGSASGPAAETAWNFMMEIAQKYKNGKILIQ